MQRVIIILLLLIAAAGGAWWYFHRDNGSNELVLYGNIDFRQLALAFNGSERVAEVLVEEGAQVKKGQVVARLDTSRLQPQVAQAEAQAASQRANLERLKNGNRPEEIAQSRANLESAKAEAVNARAQFERQNTLAPKAAVSQQALDEARSAAAVADAKVVANQKALDLLVVGSRVEDIQEAEAQLHASEANVALLHQQLADAELKAPVDAIVQSRLIEPGEMASPTRAAFSLATISPKWVRAYVSETQLGMLRPGMKANVSVDSLPGRAIPGWIGFISSVAEFTPKSVQTEELRTSLVYEVRVFVDDPDNALRLGMPATVRPLPGEQANVATAQQQ
ncbi:MULTISPECIES: efflux RND transporter periplasmic adaptor subunit [unclassified Rhizobium]|uniref:efflux RND transporter periplasmic adaptor subunit n=1 Tax=unclassified Rhizobium TaxID=2613769 RepID=UPI000DDEA8A8|nr:MULTISPECIES: efflux RND transporter periplasmic adaptor subunit [unclassified Rhizobium]MCZ3377117.1 efflux RND transporter periplasmic adaptor subunit [Rhizobium sp. AG207R]TWB12697.1 HlyD family secretion protein [Rhizobium sp. ERR1071]